MQDRIEDAYIQFYRRAGDVQETFPKGMSTIRSYWEMLDETEQDFITDEHPRTADALERFSGLADEYEDIAEQVSDTIETYEHEIAAALPETVVDDLTRPSTAYTDDENQHLDGMPDWLAWNREAILDADTGQELYNGVIHDNDADRGRGMRYQAMYEAWDEAGTAWPDAMMEVIEDDSYGLKETLEAQDKIKDQMQSTADQIRTGTKLPAYRFMATRAIGGAIDELRTKLP